MEHTRGPDYRKSVRKSHHPRGFYKLKQGEEYVALKKHVFTILHTENFRKKRGEGKLWMASERDISLRNDTAESATSIIQNRTKREHVSKRI
jgi:hypothetical protein